MSKLNNILKYGIDNNLANKIISKNLSISSLKNLSQRNLKEDYKFSDVEIRIIQERVNRQPIDDQILIELLENSAYTCNICKGVKSDAYIIHHIIHYNISQDNSYDNLVVLCPNDHELAHREGEYLAKQITEKQLRSAKNKWERYISEIPVRKAAIEGNINDIDYINVNRVLELALQIFKDEIPDTSYTHRLTFNNLILPTGQINPELYERYSLNKNTPLKFFAMYGSTMLIYHYFELLLKCLSTIELCDLDDLLNPTSLKEGIIGKYCYYVGGVYGKQYRGEINKDSEPTILHFKRKKIKVKWLIDPMFITSTTASWRIARRMIFIIYGKVLDVKKIEENQQKIIEITIRPYAYGIPNCYKDRVPIIRRVNESDSDSFEEYFDDKE
ncbi:MAG: HNH endonuclease [Bacteroidota bacterium]